MFGPIKNVIFDFDGTLVNASKEFQPFDGVEVMLQTIKKSTLSLGIFTGRERYSAQKIIRLHGWWGSYFNEENILCGDDGFASKPSGEGIVELLRRFSWVAKETLMVGDNSYDILAGNEAGVRTAAVLWNLPEGKNTERTIFREAWQRWDNIPCDLRLDSPQSLSRWLGV